MLESYVISVLRTQHFSSTLETFAAAFPEPWLVLEAGPTLATGSSSSASPKTGLMPALIDDRLPLGAAEVLATHFRDGAAPAEVTFGREAPAQIRVSNTTLSRVHLIFRRKAEGWTVEDPGSSNGTWLNSKRLPARQPQPLSDHMRLQAGQVFLTFYLASGMLDRIRTLTP